MTELEAFIGLNLISNIGSVRLNRLLEVFGRPEEIFSAKYEHLVSIFGIGSQIASNIVYFKKENIQFGLASNGIYNVLKLITKKERLEKSCVINTNPWTTAMRTLYYSAAQVSSKYRFTYGYYEIQSKISNSNNDVGQAFWF